MLRRLSGIAYAVLLVLFCGALAEIASACGQHLFPRCTTAEPCPRCTRFDESCADAPRDAGVSAIRVCSPKYISRGSNDAVLIVEADDASTLWFGER